MDRILVTDPEYVDGDILQHRQRVHSHLHVYLALQGVL